MDPHFFTCVPGETRFFLYISFKKKTIFLENDLESSLILLFF